MSAAGVTSSEAKEVVEISGSQGGGVIEGQHTTVAKHMDNISSFMMESGQLKVDALKCFADNVAEMKRLEEETDAKAQAFRNLVAMVGMAVGLPNSK